MIYDGDSPNYAACCQVAIDGDIGRMFTIHGQAFYAALAEDNGIGRLMAQLGVSVLTGFCVPAHVRLMRYALRHLATVDVLRDGVLHAGYDMAEVAVRIK